MTPSLGAFLSSIILAVLIVIIPISAALVFVSSSDKIVQIKKKKLDFLYETQFFFF